MVSANYYQKRTHHDAITKLPLIPLSDDDIILILDSSPLLKTYSKKIEVCTAEHNSKYSLISF